MNHYRIVYTVAQNLAAQTEHDACAHLDAIRDDLDEVLSENISNSTVRARLQVWVPMPCGTFPDNGQWEDVAFA